jgi:hypothetical protein
VYVAIAIVAALPWFAWRHTYFVADDWMVLARYLSFSWFDVPSWFVTVRQDWYRPLFEVAVAAGWRVLGLQPAGYHLAALAIYMAVCTLVGMLGEALTGRRLVGALATAAFALFHFHAEPVLWLAAGSDVLAAFFALASLLAYLTYRRGGRRRIYVAALIAFAAALGSKESVVLFGVAIVAYDLLLGPRPIQRGVTARWVPFLGVGGIAIAWRLAVGNPYPLDITPALLVKNAGHYAVMLLLAAPIDFDLLTLVRSPSHAPLLPSASTLASAAALVLLGGAWMVKRGWQSPASSTRALAFAALFTGAALAPVLPIVAERTAFLPSVGVAWVLAIVASGALDAGRRERSSTTDVGTRWLVVGAIVAFGAANCAAALHRGRQWQRAGAISESVMAQLVREMGRSGPDDPLPAVPPDAPVWVLNVPDHVGFAWAFRNAFHPDRPAASEVLGLGRRVQAALDVDVGANPPAAARAALGVPDRAVVFWYEGGSLKRLEAGP